jgi:NOL1/NOP2/fmu family ribosome biogenesis protein
MESVPWCPSAAYLPERPVFALDPLWHAGAYYVQEPASLLLDFALRTYAVSTLPQRVLDLCAAPGGKTTLLADFLTDDSLLVANEVIRSRERILVENVTRWGWPNVVLSNHDPEDFSPLSGFFDIVVVDAPCSGEGLFRKDANAIGEWSEKATELCAARQERILTAALPLVQPGGLLLYSTCTYNPSENDARITDIVGTGEWEPLPLPLPPEWGITPTEFGVQCWPQRCRGEGFYLAVLRRVGGRTPTFPSPLPGTITVPEGVRSLLAQPDRFLYRINPHNGIFTATPSSVADTVAFVTSALPRTKSGLPLATIKGRDIIPTPELAVSVAASAQLPAVDLDLETARTYLRKNPLTLPEGTPMGWLLVRYAGMSLGWVKNLGDRVNNYLPNEWRLRYL